MYMKRCVEEGGAVETDGQWIYFIPICTDGHWGVVVKMRDGPGSAIVGWGDGMYLSPPTTLLNVIVDVYHDVYDRWLVSFDGNENWMEKTLQFGFITEAYRCGFYVLEAIRKMGSNESALPTVFVQHMRFEVY